jgi:F0F1-type ATP synthase epsilon subunit
VEIEAESGERTTIGVHGGFIQVVNNQVTLITDRAQVAESHAQAKETAERLAAEDAEADEEA